MDTKQKMTADDFRLPPDPERIVNGLRDNGAKVRRILLPVIKYSGSLTHVFCLVMKPTCVNQTPPGSFHIAL